MGDVRCLRCIDRGVRCARGARVGNKRRRAPQNRDSIAYLISSMQEKTLGVHCGALVAENQPLARSPTQALSYTSGVEPLHLVRRVFSRASTTAEPSCCSEEERSWATALDRNCPNPAISAADPSQTPYRSILPVTEHRLWGSVRGEWPERAEVLVPFRSGKNCDPSGGKNSD
jgi:hypothetical protein